MTTISPYEAQIRAAAEKLFDDDQTEECIQAAKANMR